jgi:sugar transferase (PEP-CTERM/EpsH1 system associated)
MDASFSDGPNKALSNRRPLSILVIAAVFPYPPDDGTKIQIFNRIRYLSERNTITLLCIGPEAVPARLQENMRAYCRIRWLQAPGSRKSARAAGKVWNFLRSLCYGVPYDIRDFCSPRIRAAIDQILSEGGYDVIEADTHAAFFFRKEWRPFKVSIFHNVAVAALARMIANLSRPCQRLKYRIYQSLYRRYERTVCSNSDLCVTLTSQNEAELRAVAPRSPIVNCLTNGIDLDYFHYQPSARPPSAVCFVGLMRYEPNIDAVAHFCNDIFPTLRQLYGNLRFFIVGASPTEDVQRLGDEPGVVVTGHVEDVRPWLIEAGIAIIPIRLGGGILNKILEALALGVPVVTYPHCVEGLDTQNGQELLIARNAPDFGVCIKRLVESAALRKTLSENGRRYVEIHHQWRMIISRYEAEIRSRIAMSRSRADEG